MHTFVDLLGEETQKMKLAPEYSPQESVRDELGPFPAFRWYTRQRKS